MLAHLGQIPVVNLQHNAQQVPFAIKAMEEIDDDHGGKNEPPHRHDFFVVIWHKQGAGTHLVDFEQYELSPDQVYFLAPGQVHQIVSRSRPKGWVILFSRFFLESAGLDWTRIEQLGLFEPCTKTPPLLLAGYDTQRLDDLCGQMRNEQDQQLPGAELAIGHLLTLFLLQLHRYKQTQTRVPEVNSESTTGRQQQTVQQFNRLVEREHSKLHQVGQYADLLNVSTGYLNELIRTYTGRTAKDVIMDRVLIAAKRDALFSDKSSKEVAFGLGFEDPAHFSKFFKQATNQTFIEYRQGVRATLPSIA